MCPYTPGSNGSAGVQGPVEFCPATERQARKVARYIMLHILVCPRCAEAFSQLKAMPVVAKAWPVLTKVVQLN